VTLTVGLGSVDAGGLLDGDELGGGELGGGELGGGELTAGELGRVDGEVVVGLGLALRDRLRDGVDGDVEALPEMLGAVVGVVVPAGPVTLGVGSLPTSTVPPGLPPVSLITTAITTIRPISPRMSSRAGDRP